MTQEKRLWGQRAEQCQVTPGGVTPEPELPAAVGPALLGQGTLRGCSIPLSTGHGPKGVAVWGVDEKAEHMAWDLRRQVRGTPQRLENSRRRGAQFPRCWPRMQHPLLCPAHTPASPPHPSTHLSEDASGFFLEASPTLHGHVLALCVGQSRNGN